MTTPRIYIADLAAYNNGYLHGVWIDATDELDEIYKHIRTMLSKSPIDNSEEWALHDYEYFGNVKLSEWENLESVQKMACFIEEHGDLAIELIQHFDNIDEAITALSEHYVGEFTSLAEYAENTILDTSEIPEHLKYYIDYSSMGRDWEMSGDIFTIETGFEEIHVFHNL